MKKPKCMETILIKLTKFKLEDKMRGMWHDTSCVTSVRNSTWKNISM